MHTSHHRARHGIFGALFGNEVTVLDTVLDEEGDVAYSLIESHDASGAVRYQVEIALIDADIPTDPIYSRDYRSLEAARREFDRTIAGI